MYFIVKWYNDKHESLKRGKYLGSISGEINDLKIADLLTKTNTPD
jgi:hypothetical protein